MKKIQLYLLLGLLLVLHSCSNSTIKKAPDSAQSTEASTKSILLSFAFVGCNRLKGSDVQAGNLSTANLHALQRIYKDMTALERQPDLFFFLGDMVRGLKDTKALDEQLGAWVELYENTEFSKISETAIELVAVPGNHEMLYFKSRTAQHEIPLAGATDVWMKHMARFIPKDAQRVTGEDAANNRATYAFVRGKVGFIVMNTDTYNATPDADGTEGHIPLDWITNKARAFQQNPAIEHVFVLGHKPYYVNGQPRTDHVGLPDGPVLWPALRQSRVVAMLSAHVHDYERLQPLGNGTYQVTAGNGGSKGTATFFGYTLINIWSNGEVELDSRGFTIGKKYDQPVPKNPMTSRDHTTLTWEKNATPYVRKEAGK